MKAVLIVDIPEDFNYLNCDIGGDGNIYYSRKGERSSIIGNIKNLKSLPKKKNINYAEKLNDDYYVLYTKQYADGFNACVDEILKKN